MVWIVGATPPGMDPRTVRRVQNPMSPNDTTVFAADFSGPLGAVEGDTIAQVTSVNITRNDSGSDNFTSVLPPQLSADKRRVILWLTGGTGGYEYLVSIRVTSVAEQSLTRSFIVPVMSR